jgi:protein-S-isoprenylcysteine O-methyltransferase Ste14
MRWTLFSLLALAWGVSEVILAVAGRARRGSVTSHDRGSLRFLSLAIYPSVALAVFMAQTRFGHYRVPPPLVATAFAVFILGIVIRWVAIITLGRYFSVNVVIHDDHRIVDRGIYGVIRHPSYTGALLSFIGFGLAMGNFFSLALMTIPISAAFLYRMHVEEQALVGAFGDEYVAYSRRTKRLFPGIY